MKVNDIENYKLYHINHTMNYKSTYPVTIYQFVQSMTLNTKKTNEDRVIDEGTKTLFTGTKLESMMYGKGYRQWLNILKNIQSII